MDSRTAKRWLSILQASFIVFLVQPYYRNFNKRLVKRPKIFFCDTGLACSLLGLRTAESVALSPFRGGLFENVAFAERVKRAYAQGRPARPGRMARVLKTRCSVHRMAEATYNSR